MSFSLSLFLLDGANPNIFTLYGFFWGIVLFIVAVVLEFLVLRYGFQFQKEKLFRYTLIANAASVLAGTITVFFLPLTKVANTLSIFYSLILTIVIETYVWIRLIKPEEFQKRTILQNLIAANIVSYLFIFGGLLLITSTTF